MTETTPETYRIDIMDSYFTPAGQRVEITRPDWSGKTCSACGLPASVHAWIEVRKAATVAETMLGDPYQRAVQCSISLAVQALNDDALREMARCMGEFKGQS